MTIVFDPTKNQFNLNKHGLSFTDAIPFLSDPNPDIEYDEENSTIAEDRYRGTYRHKKHYK